MKLLGTSVAHLLSTKVYEWRGKKLYAYLFFTGMLEDFCYVLWLSLATQGLIPLVMIFVYVWSSIHDSYYAIPTEVWQDKNARRFEKLGSAIGAGLSLWLFPMQ